MRPEEINAEILQSMVRDEMVPVYTAMLFDNVHPDQVQRINSLIIKRWSNAALIYIKDKAWKIYDPDGSKFLGEEIKLA